MHYVYMALLVTLPIFAMDPESGSSSDEKPPLKARRPLTPKPQKVEAPAVLSLPLVPPLMRIGSMEGLKQIRQSDRSNNPSSSRREGFTVAPAVAANVVHTVVFKQDPSDRNIAITKKIQEKFAQLEEHDPKTYDKINNHIFMLNDKYDGDISAQGIQRYKSKKMVPVKRGAPLDSPQGSISDSSKRKVNNLMEQQLSLRQEVEHQEEALEEMAKEYQEMKALVRQLTLQAAEDATQEAEEAKDVAESDAAKANQLMKVSIIAGTVTSVALGALSAVLTYYTSNCGHSSTGTNGTA